MLDASGPTSVLYTFDFYDELDIKKGCGGRLLSVDLWTGLNEDYTRIRAMTPGERRELLQAIFEVSERKMVQVPFGVLTETLVEQPPFLLLSAFACESRELLPSNFDLLLGEIPGLEFERIFL